MTEIFIEECRQKWDCLAKLQDVSSNNRRICYQLLVGNMKNILITQCNNTEYIVSNGFKSPNKFFNKQATMKYSNASGYDFRCHTEEENLANFIWGGEQLNTLQDCMPMNILLDEQIL